MSSFKTDQARHQSPSRASIFLLASIALVSIWLAQEPKLDLVLAPTGLLDKVLYVCHVAIQYAFYLVMVPIEFLDTVLHEMGHALFCVATGGTVHGLTIVGDGAGHAGLTFTSGGIPFIYNQTGYLGTTLFGCLMLWLGRGRAACRAVLIALGLLIAVVSLLFMTRTLNQAAYANQAVGSIFTGLALAAALILAGAKLSDRLAQYLLLFLGVQISLGAVNDVIWLAKLSLGMVGSYGFTDATNQAQLTHLPAAFWSVLWAVLSLLMLFFTLKLAYGSSRAEEH